MATVCRIWMNLLSSCCGPTCSLLRWEPKFWTKLWLGPWYVLSSLLRIIMLQLKCGALVQFSREFLLTVSHRMTLQLSNRYLSPPVIWFSVTKIKAFLSGIQNEKGDPYRSYTVWQNFESGKNPAVRAITVPLVALQCISPGLRESLRPVPSSIILSNLG